MDERMRFVIRHKDGESMTSLCREFDVSRKTGYHLIPPRLTRALYSGEGG